jgi:hypothetical protein
MAKRMKAQPVEPARMTEQGRRMSSFINLNPEGSAAMEKKRNSGGIKGVLGGMEGASEFSLPLDDDDNDDARSTNSTSTPEQSTGGATQRNLEPEIAARENALVFYSKLLVMSVLLLSAGGVGFLTWWFIAGEEEDDYKAQVSIYVYITCIMLCMFVLSKGLTIHIMYSY